MSRHRQGAAQSSTRRIKRCWPERMVEHGLADGNLAQPVGSSKGDVGVRRVEELVGHGGRGGWGQKS